MSAIDYPAVYDDLLDLLAESADAKRVLALRLSDEKQARLDEPLASYPSGAIHGRKEEGYDRLWRLYVLWRHGRPEGG